MKVRDILSDQETREHITASPTGSVGRDSTNDLNALGAGRIHDGSSTDPVDGDAIDQVGVAKILSGADVAREETERVRFDSGEAKPPDPNTDPKGSLSWEEWYDLLWKYKVAVWDKNHRRVFVPLREDDPLVIAQKKRVPR